MAKNDQRDAAEAIAAQIDGLIDLAQTYKLPCLHHLLNMVRMEAINEVDRHKQKIDQRSFLERETA